jgi:hypothetical protein
MTLVNADTDFRHDRRVYTGYIKNDLARTKPAWTQGGTKDKGQRIKK